MITPPLPGTQVPPDWVSLACHGAIQNIIVSIIERVTKTFPRHQFIYRGSNKLIFCSSGFNVPSVNNSLPPISSVFSGIIIIVETSQIRNVQKLLAQREQKPQFSVLPWNCQQWLEKWSKPVGVPRLKRFNEFNLKSEAEARSFRSYPRIQLCWYIHIHMSWR